MDEVTRVEFERIHDEETRQNKRIDLLEQSVSAQQKIALSVEKLALSMEQMLKEQEKQGKRLEELEKEPVKELVHSIERLQKEQEDCSGRLDALEQKPAQQWNNMTRTIFTSVISTISGGLAVGVIMLIAQNIK